MAKPKWNDGDVVMFTGNGVILFRQCGRWVRNDGGLVWNDSVDSGMRDGYLVVLVRAKDAIKEHVPDKMRRPRVGTHEYRETPRYLDWGPE